MAEVNKEIVLPSTKDRRNGKIYKIRKILESNINQEYEAEKARLAATVESDSEDELENIIAAAEEESFLSSFNVPWSEASADGGSASQPNHPNQNELTNATFSNMFDVLSKHLTQMLEDVIQINQKTDYIQQLVTSMSDRLGRVEQKAKMSMNGMMKVQDTVLMANVVTKKPKRPFKLISTARELNNFNTRLGADEKFYSTAKEWLRTQIEENDPQDRMQAALVLVFERNFLGGCNWTDWDKRKICFGSRVNIFRLFADVGANENGNGEWVVALTAAQVHAFFKKKLIHAGKRAYRLKHPKYSKSKPTDK